MPGLRLRLFGGFDLRSELGTPVIVSQRKVLGLLVYLALQTDRPHTRDRLMALLWGDSPTEQARASLRQALVPIRKLFPDQENALISDQATVTLASGRVGTDVADFQRSISVDGGFDAGGAMALYRGDLLEGVHVPAAGFEEWLGIERQALRHQAIESFGRLLARAMESGSTDQAVGVGLKLLTLDPIHEKVHRTLMELYARQGRYDAALRQYENCRAALKRDLGVLPEPETDSLARDLRSRRLKHRPAGAPAADRPDRERAPPDREEDPAVEEEIEDSRADEPRSFAGTSPLSPWERRNVTVLCATMHDYDDLLARRDPEEVRQLVHSHHERCLRVVDRFGGAVNNFLGPGVVITFGYPSPLESAAECAVSAALSLVDGDAGPGPGQPLSPSACRVGVATSVVVIGDLLSWGETRVRELVGEAPTLAIHLCALAAPGTALVSRTTRQLVGNLFHWEDLGRQTIPGRLQPFDIHRVLGHGASVSRFHSMRGHRSAPFVGRDMEVGLLLDRWSAACGGEGQGVLLCGDAGMGKSRIIEAFRQRIAGSPHAEMRLQCAPKHEDSALHPFIRYFQALLGSALGDSRQDADRLDRLAAQHGLDRAGVAVPLARLLSIGAPESAAELPSPQRQRTLIFDALSAWVAGLARSGPLLLIVEDAHWIDPTTSDVLSSLAAGVPSQRILMIVSHRPDFACPWARRDMMTSLTLNRLGRAHCLSIVENVAGRPVPEAVAWRIIDTADGVPLFVEELTRAVFASGLPESGSELRLNVPDSLRDLLRDRLARCGPSFEIAQIAGAMGREFRYDVLVRAAEKPEQAVRGALDDLIEADLVLPASAEKDSVYAFRHVLIQEAAYASLLRESRIRIHGAIARALEEHGAGPEGDEPETLARHWFEAADYGRACRLWLQAAEAMCARSSHPEALIHLHRALMALRCDQALADHAELEIDVQTLLGTIHLITRGFASADAGQALERARLLCERTRDHAREVRVLGALIHHRMVSGDLAGALAHSKRCMTLGERHGIPAYRQIAHCGYAGGLLWSGAFQEGTVHADESIDLSRLGAEPSVQLLAGGDAGVYALCYAALFQWQLGHLDQAGVRVEQAQDLAESLRHPFSRAYAYGHGAALHLLLGDAAAVRDKASRGMALCLEHGFSYYMNWCLFLDGWALAAGGDESGIHRMREGEVKLLDSGTRLRTSWYALLRAERLLAFNRIDEAEAVFEIAEQRAAEGNERWQDAEFYRIRGLFHARRGERAAAETCWRDAVGAARRKGSRMLELRASCDLARQLRMDGRAPEVRTLLEPLLLKIRGGNSVDVDGARHLLATLAGEPRRA